MPRKTPRPNSLPVYLGSPDERARRKAALEEIASNTVQMEKYDKSGVSKLIQKIADGELKVVAS